MCPRMFDNERCQDLTLLFSVFWGFGELAGAQAGKMKQQGRLWVLFPKGGEPALN